MTLSYRTLASALLRPDVDLDAPAYLRLYVDGIGHVDVPVQTMRPSIGLTTSVCPGGAMPLHTESDDTAMVYLAIALLDSASPEAIGPRARRLLAEAVSALIGKDD